MIDNKPKHRSKGRFFKLSQGENMKVSEVITIGIICASLAIPALMTVWACQPAIKGLTKGIIAILELV